MIVRISDIADAQGGIVLSRKEAKKPGANSHKYKRLTLRALSDIGFIEDSELEDFFSSESLNNALFTQIDDVVVRLAFPLFPAIVSEGHKGLLVPSQVVVLKVRDRNVIIPEFLRLCLARKDILDWVQKIESGTAQRTVKIGTILDLQIAVPDLDTQRRAVAIDELCRKRERLYHALIEQERLKTDYIIENIIGGNT